VFEPFLLDWQKWSIAEFTTFVKLFQANTKMTKKWVQIHRKVVLQLLVGPRNKMQLDDCKLLAKLKMPLVI